MATESTTTDDADEDRATEPGAPAVETVVPDDADPARCPYCDRPFVARAHVDLHVGLAHYDACTDAEADAFEDAYLAENEEIRLFRLKAAALVIVLYFVLLMTYSVVT